MKLSSAAVDAILHVISTFDRERGIPHDYHQLETVLRNTAFTPTPEGDLAIAAEVVPAEQRAGLRPDGPLDDVVEAKAMFLEAARSWLDD